MSSRVDFIMSMRRKLRSSMVNHDRTEDMKDAATITHKDFFTITTITYRILLRHQFGSPFRPFSCTPSFEKLSYRLSHLPTRNSASFSCSSHSITGIAPT